LTIASGEGSREPWEITWKNPRILKREIKALAFDQYGTIVDMQKGLTEAVTPLCVPKIRFCNIGDAVRQGPAGI